MRMLFLQRNRFFGFLRLFGPMFFVGAFLSSCERPANVDRSEHENMQLELLEKKTPLVPSEVAAIPKNNNICDLIETHVVAGQYGNIPILPIVDVTATSPQCLYKLSVLLLESRISNVMAKNQALDYLKASASKGFVPALMYLYDSYKRGEIVKKNSEKATTYKKQAVALGWDEASSAIAKEGKKIILSKISTALEGKNYLPYDLFLKGMAATHKKEHDIAKKYLMQAANIGHADAYYELAMMEVAKIEEDPAVIGRLRLAAFYGNARAHHNIGVFALRKYAAGKSIMSPTGKISGQDLLDLAFAHLNASEIQNIGKSRTYLTKIQTFSTDLLDPKANRQNMLSDKTRKFLANVQPFGRGLPTLYPAKQLAWKPFSCMDTCRSGLEHWEGRSTDDLALKIYSKKGRPISVAAVEIWDPASATKIAVRKITQSNPFVPTSVCKSWYGDGCEGETIQNISLKDIKSGFYVYRLISLNGIPYQPVAMYLYPDKREQPAQASDLGICQAKNTNAKTVLFVHPTYTWQAYATTGGGSLYKSPIAERIYAVNMNRPLPSAIGSSHHNYRSVLGVLRMACQKEIRVKHITSSQLDKISKIPSDIDAAFLIGHDEYWSKKVGDNLRNYVQDGGKLVVLSGNTGWFQVRTQDENAIINKGKDDDIKLTNVLSHEWLSQFDLKETGLTMSARVERHVEKFTGVTYESGGYAVAYIIPWASIEERRISAEIFNKSSQAYVIDAGHPVFKGMNLGKHQAFCGSSNFIDMEIDSMPLLGPDFVPNYQWLSRANSKTKIISAAYVFNRNVAPYNRRSKPGRLHFSGIIVEAGYGDKGGTVFTVGSMTAYRLAFAQDTKCQSFLGNVIDYVLTTPDG